MYKNSISPAKYMNKMTVLPIIYKKALLKVIVDFLILLIGAEGTKTPVGVRFRRDPAGVQAPRRLAETPTESEVPEAEINRTANTAY
jgi:hypothetical protein